MNTRWLMAFVAFLLCACALKIKVPDEKSLTDYVNPFIGTAGKGKTYPGATVPYGMVQLSPDNGRNGWDWISGYFYPDSVISGFSHLHLSGTGAGDLYDISFLPTSGKLKIARLDSINSRQTVHSKFSHSKESATPGYYQVYLDDYKVNVELTATARSGLQKYTFDGDDYSVRLHLGYTRNWDKVVASKIKIVNDSTITGYRKSVGWARDQRVYFKTVFSSPFVHQISNENGVTKGDSIEGRDILAEFSFATKKVMVKTGLSSVSEENAALNLASEQIGFDFEGVKKNASHLWEQSLSHVKIDADEDNMVQFYTAMYHSKLAPTLYSDVNGQYKGTDGAVWTAKGHPRYTTYSLWDTYRALHPWMTIAEPDSVSGIINSMFDFYNENGLLPVWNMWGSETNMMMGYHAVPVVTDAILKGMPGIDKKLAYEAVKASAMQDHYDLKEYKSLGFIPYEKGEWNVSRTMEYAYDDWCVAQLAKVLEQEEDYDYFMKRAGNYQNHFDKGTGFFRARSFDGEFKPAFDPLAYHPADYCEANAWQYLWYVPQDMGNLINLMGGQKVFTDKLDELFTVSQSEGNAPAWISGYIGQYVHGNEPSHHVPYLYQYVDAPEKTQLRVRQVMSELYDITPGGLAGNEDCGQMSAWYLFSALGFYPVNPASGEYIIGSPEVKEATISVGLNKTFKVIAKNQSEENIYVKSVTLNGEALEGFILTHDQIMNGGELIFEMANEY